MAQADWRNRLQQNARKTAQFWAEEGVSITQDSERPKSVSSALAMGVTCVAAGLAAGYSVHQAPGMELWSDQARNVIALAAGVSGVGFGSGVGKTLANWIDQGRETKERLTGASASPVEGHERQRELQQAVGQLFETMDNDPKARSELVRLLQSDEGRDMFLNTMERSSPEAAAEQLLRTSQAQGEQDDEQQDPSSGPSLS